MLLLVAKAGRSCLECRKLFVTWSCESSFRAVLPRGLCSSSSSVQCYVQGGSGIGLSYTPKPVADLSDEEATAAAAEAAASGAIDASPQSDAGADSAAPLLQQSS